MRDCEALDYSGQQLERIVVGTNVSAVTICIRSDAETAARVRDLCSSAAMDWEVAKHAMPGLEFDAAGVESTVIIGAISTITTAVCAVLRAIVKERKRIVVIERHGEKYRFENVATDEIEKTLSAAQQSVEIRII